MQFLYANNAGFFLKPTTKSKNGTPPDPNPSEAAGGDARGGSSSLLDRLGKLSTDMEVEVDDDDKILDCRAAQPPLVECLATKHSRVGIKGRI